MFIDICEEFITKFQQTLILRRSPQGACDEAFGYVTCVWQRHIRRAKQSRRQFFLVQPVAWSPNRGAMPELNGRESNRLTHLRARELCTIYWPALYYWHVFSGQSSTNVLSWEAQESI